MAKQIHYQFWQAGNGQWYWHYKVNGKVTSDGGGYNHRSSVRRAIRRDAGYFGVPMEFIEKP